MSHQRRQGKKLRKIMDAIRASRQAISPRDLRDISQLTEKGFLSGESKGSAKAGPQPKASCRNAKKTARHMRYEALYRGGERISMQSTSGQQWASDYTKQLAPRDGASFKGSTGKTFLRRGVS